MMRDRLDLGSAWKLFIEMTAPSGRIFALAVPSDSRPVENAFDTTPHPACSFGLCCPNRLQGLDNKANINRGYWQISEYGANSARTGSRVTSFESLQRDAPKSEVELVVREPDAVTYDRSS
jgi:hypothetical protein